MSTTKPYFPAHSSVLQYLNYIRLRLRDGFAIDNDEENNTYEYYVQFCEDNDLEFYAYNMFYRELKKYGFEAEIKIIKKFYSGPEINEKDLEDDKEFSKILNDIIDLPF